MAGKKKNLKILEKNGRHERVAETFTVKSNSLAFSSRSVTDKNLGNLNIK